MNAALLPVRCISQIAWSAAEHQEALNRTRAWGVTGIEIAPSLLFADQDDPFVPDPAAVRAAVGAFGAYGLSTPSMQALLTNAPQAQLFGDTNARAALDTRILRCLRIAGAMGVRNLVFGSPKQRVVPDGMDTNEAFTMALDTITRWNAWAIDHGCTIGLECNPPLYGGNWWTDHGSLLGFVRVANLPNIGITLDMGATVLTDTDPVQLAATLGTSLTHIHWSAPNLHIPRVDTTTCTTLAALRQHHPILSLEMARQPNGLDAVDSVFAAINSAMGHQV